MVERILAKHRAGGDPELRTLLEILATAMPPGTLNETCAAIVAWRRALILRERQRVCQIFEAGFDLDLLADAIDWAAKSDLSANEIIAALRQRAASEPCGVPS